MSNEESIMKDRYEQNDNPYVDFDVKVSFALEKRCKINTDDYELVHDDFEKCSWENTENTDWAKAYEESHFTIGEMLDELRRYVEKEMCIVEPCSGQGRYLKRLLNDLQDWELVDTNYELV